MNFVRSLPHPLEQSLPSFDEIIDRLYRRHIVGGTRRLHMRCRTHVDRQDIEGDGRPIAADYFLVNVVDADRFVMVDARAGELRQRAQIDMCLVESVMAGDVTRQHPRIGRMYVPRDERHAHACQRLHAEVLQHGDVAVATTNEYQIFDDGCIGFHLNSPSRPCGTRPSIASYGHKLASIRMNLRTHKFDLNYANRFPVPSHISENSKPNLA